MSGATDVLGEDGYERLRRAAETHREDLVIRLGGEVGLRPAEMTRVRLDDVVAHDEQYFLQVRDEDGVTREAYLPTGVEHDLRKYANVTDSAADEPLVPVSSRRLQMLVTEVAARAAEAEPRLADVSSRDLRWRFAAGLLDDGVPPDVVCALGGWNRLARLEPLLESPDRETILAALGDDDSGMPAALRRTITGLADIGETLLGAATAEEIELTVCDRFADAEGVQFAWVAERTGEQLTRTAADGIGPETVDRQLDDHTENTLRALESHDVVIVEEQHGPLALIPVLRDDAASGILGIGTTTEITDPERDLLAVLGAQIGYALAAAERKRLLLADTVTELELRCSDDAAFTVGLSRELDCTVELSGIVPVSGQSLLYYLVVDGAPAPDVLSYATGHPTVTDARLIENYGDGALIEVVVDAAPARSVVESGGRVTDLAAEAGMVTISVELPTDANVRAVVDTVVAAYPATELTVKREKEQPAETTTGFRDRISDHLSERQETVLRAAYHSGYFEWPRDSTAEELADSLAVASPTLHNHLRKAQQKILTELFADSPVRSTTLDEE